MLIGILTDVHEDAEGLRKAIKEFEKRKCDMLVSLGDIVGFDRRFYNHVHSRNASYCIEAVASQCKIAVVGNHDLNAIRKLPSYRKVFDFPKNWYDLPLEERKKISNQRIWTYDYDIPIALSSIEKEIIDKFPESFILATDDCTIVFSHSIYPDIAGCLTVKPTSVSEFNEHTKQYNNNHLICISGHHHPSGVVKINSTKINIPKFSVIPIKEYPVHFICPCIADGSQDIGISILNTKEKTIEAIPLRAPKQNIF